MAACNKIFSGNGRHVVIYDMITITLNVGKQMNMLIMTCLPSLQIWALSSMPSCLPIFSNFQCLYKFGLSFQEENFVEDLELDKDLYPRIICHL